MVKRWEPYNKLFFTLKFGYIERGDKLITNENLDKQYKIVLTIVLVISFSLILLLFFYKPNYNKNKVNINIKINLL